MRVLIKYLSIWVSLLNISTLSASEQVSVAVASNFLSPLQHVREKFEQQFDIKLKISAGSTSKLFVQIMHGAPIDVFLAADQVTPEILLKKNKALEKTLFQYARGTLVLYSKQQGLDENKLRFHLTTVSKEKIGLANPKLAPYGLAAQQVLESMGVYSEIKENLVFGENVGQAFQFVYSGNVKIGFVALSQVLSRDSAGSYWIVPLEWYQPIYQYGVILNRAKTNTAAHRFVDFLLSEQIQNILVEKFGYSVRQ